ncbi:MAG: hypothetical protein DRJ38_04435 [Thermoprotei archaeon]|nr:MAG: hypothetical protein DRJ38_04435 [Thermoprotei archaeon]
MLSLVNTTVKLWKIWPKGLTAVFLLSLVFTLAGIVLAHIHPIFLPLLSTIAVYPQYLFFVVTRKFKKAVALILAWALLLTLLIIVFSYYMPETAAGIILNGEKYRKEMFEWIKTGQGPEGDPNLFLVPKIIEIIMFSLLSVLTLGFAALLLGAYLLNYMNYYVGILLLHAKPELSCFLTVALFSWPIYAIIRVVGYVSLGVALTWFSYNLLFNYFIKRTVKIKLGPLYSLTEVFAKKKRTIDVTSVKTLLLIAFTFIILDFILKATVANMIYQPILNSNVIIP